MFLINAVKLGHVAFPGLLCVVSRQVTQHHLALLWTPRSLGSLRLQWGKCRCQVTNSALLSGWAACCTLKIAISLLALSSSSRLIFLWVFGRFSYIPIVFDAPRWPDPCPYRPRDGPPLVYQPLSPLPPEHIWIRQFRRHEKFVVSGRLRWPEDGWSRWVWWVGLYTPGAFYVGCVRTRFILVRTCCIDRIIRSAQRCSNRPQCSPVIPSRVQAHESLNPNITISLIEADCSHTCCASLNHILRAHSATHSLHPVIFDNYTESCPLHPTPPQSPSSSFSSSPLMSRCLRHHFQLRPSKIGVCLTHPLPTTS